MVHMFEGKDLRIIKSKFKSVKPKMDTTSLKSPLVGYYFCLKIIYILMSQDKGQAYDVREESIVNSCKFFFFSCNNSCLNKQNEVGTLNDNN